MKPENVIYSIDNKPLVEEILEIRPLLKIELVSRTELEALWNHLVESYHYLGYKNMIGPRVKYLVWFNERPIAAISYNQASYRLGVRDTFIDWNPEERKRSLPHVLNNNRFLILPWVHVKNPVSYTHLQAHETRHDLVCRLLLEKKKTNQKKGTEKYLTPKTNKTIHLIKKN